MAKTFTIIAGNRDFIVDFDDLDKDCSTLPMTDSEISMCKRVIEGLVKEEDFVVSANLINGWEIRKNSTYYK